MNREEELAQAWQAVCRDVAESCRRHDRALGDVSIIAVTKGFPASDVIALAHAGVTDVGESRDQEARPKREQVQAASAADLTWHAIGQVQTNKAAHVATWANMVHGVDRLRLVSALASGVRTQRPLPVLIQVRSSASVQHGSTGRAGVEPTHLPHLIESVLGQSRLELRGLMTVADPAHPARAQFEEVASLWQNLRSHHPGANVFSAGMSGDFDDAVAAGATHLRIGTAILGSRTLGR